MKKHLDWFIVPCVATMFGGSVLTVNAQDPPKLSRVVVHQVHGDVDAKSIRDKVAKELENAGIPEETKASILKNVENALNKAKEARNNAKKEVEVELKSTDGDAKEVKETRIEIRNQKGSPGKENVFTTHFFRDPKNDGYRIGIQCIQVDDGDDKAEAEPGLEVKAVLDDSPAKKAGIEEGDILVSVNGTKISKIVDLTNALQEAGKNEKEVAIEVKRDKKVVSVTVKPTKMKASDIELENIQLSLPTGGFVLHGDAVKSFQDHMKSFQGQMKQFGTKDMTNGTHVLNLQSNSVDLKKDIEELKSELADLKKMIKELVDKK